MHASVALSRDKAFSDEEEKEKTKAERRNSRCQTKNPKETITM